MKKASLEYAIAKATECAVKKNVNSCCWFMMHQNKVPEAAMKKFKK